MAQQSHGTFHFSKTRWPYRAILCALRKNPIKHHIQKMANISHIFQKNINNNMVPTFLGMFAFRVYSKGFTAYKGTKSSKKSQHPDLSTPTLFDYYVIVSYTVYQWIADNWPTRPQNISNNLIEILYALFAPSGWFPAIHSYQLLKTLSCPHNPPTLVENISSSYRMIFSKYVSISVLASFSLPF